jgi:hypothetical protein
MSPAADRPDRHQTDDDAGEDNRTRNITSHDLPNGRPGAGADGSNWRNYSHAAAGEPSVQRDDCKGATQPGDDSPPHCRPVEAASEERSHDQHGHHTCDVIEENDGQHSALAAPEATEEISGAGKSCGRQGK